MPEQQMTEEQKKELEEKIKNMSPEELAEFQKKQCVFCQILAGKIPAKKVYDDDLCVAILDINPAAKGHVLLIPKEHYAIMPQIPEKVIERMFSVSKKISQAILKSLKVDGTNVFIANGLAAGQRAQHFMIHIIPRKSSDKIFEVKEKLIDKNTRNKFKLLVETKLNGILGVKKKVYEYEEKKSELTEAEKLIEEKLSVPSPAPQPTMKKSSLEVPARKSKKNTPSKPKEEPSLDDIASLFT